MSLTFHFFFIYYLYTGKGYFFSWRDPATRNTEEDWLGGRNYCRQRCMDLVSIETQDENEWIKSRLVRENVRSVWDFSLLCGRILLGSNFRSNTSGLLDVSVTSKAATGPICSRPESGDGSGPLSSKSWLPLQTDSKTTGPKTVGSANLNQTTG